MKRDSQSSVRAASASRLERGNGVLSREGGRPIKAQGSHWNEQSFRRIVETTREGIWIADLRGITTYVNMPMAHMLGTKSHVITGQSVFDFVFEQDRGAVQRHFAEFLGTPNGKWVEERLRRIDGSEFYALVAASVICDRTGKPTHYLGMFTDITERRRTEAALRNLTESLEFTVRDRTAELVAANRTLRESEEKYHQLFETVPDGALVFDPETFRIAEVNNAALRLYGYTREEFLKLDVFAVTAERQKTETSIRLTRARSALRIPVRYHRKKDGTIFPVEISAGSFLLNGRPMVCGLIRDITERHQAEEAAHQREQELAAFFAESPLGLLWVGPDGLVRRVNQALTDMLGATTQQLMGHHVGDIFSNREIAAGLLDRLANGHTIRHYRAQVRCLNSSIREVLVHANCLWDGSRQVYSRWFIWDVTRNVELEREILTISEQEQRRFGQDLHDDLCQQLAGIEFLTQRLAGSLAALGSRNASQAKEIAGMVQQAMEQTRDLARGLSPVRLEAEGLATALSELAARTRSVFRVDCRFTCDVPVLVPDPGVAFHLYRIVQEAVRNALRHAKPRHIGIGLRVDGNRLALTVKDDGIGIPAAVGNTGGMGLQIMRYRAEAIGGLLKVQPARDRGTEMICTLQAGRGNSRPKRAT
jgi:PAS domain S-box-containing protein